MTVIYFHCCALRPKVVSGNSSEVTNGVVNCLGGILSTYDSDVFSLLCTQKEIREVKCIVWHGIRFKPIA